MQISRIGSAPAEDSGGGRRTEASEGGGSTEGWCQQHATLGRLLRMGERAEAGPGGLPALLLKTEPRKTFFSDYSLCIEPFYDSSVSKYQLRGDLFLTSL